MSARRRARTAARIALLTDEVDGDLCGRGIDVCDARRSACAVMGAGAADDAAGGVVVVLVEDSLEGELPGGQDDLGVAEQFGSGDERAQPDIVTHDSIVAVERSLSVLTV